MKRLGHLLLGSLMPITVLILVPGALFLGTGGWDTPPETFGRGGWMIAAGVLASIGFGLAVWTGGLFWWARGTPAPWYPPEEFVVEGPYRFVRNPMILGVLLVLAAEAIVAKSWLIGLWMVVFWGMYHGWLLAYEEPDLERRFGERFRRYRKRVPRWCPRLKPLNPGVLKQDEETA